MGKQLTLIEMPLSKHKGEAFTASMSVLVKAPKELQDTFLRVIRELGMSPHSAATIVLKEIQHLAWLDSQSISCEVPNKSTMYRLLGSGRFGNRQMNYPIADSEDWMCICNNHKVNQGAPHPLWALRYKKPGYRQWSCYDLPPQIVWPTYCDYIAEGADPTLFNLTPMQDDTAIVVQGEIQRSAQHGWCFRVSKEKKPMNVALGGSQVEHHFGPGYWLYLKQIMTAIDYEDINELLDTFPDAVIEFSVYNQQVGNCPNRKTIIWEVRNY